LLCWSYIAVAQPLHNSWHWSPGLFYYSSYCCNSNVRNTHIHILRDFERVLFLLLFES
jgi:hypothetical protein